MTPSGGTGPQSDVSGKGKFSKDDIMQGNTRMLMEDKLEIMLLPCSEEGSVAKWFVILPTFTYVLM